MGRFIKPVCCICGEAGKTFDDQEWKYQDLCPKHSFLLETSTEIKDEIKKYMTPDKLLDKYYKPKMHWKSVNRINVIAAMNDFSATNVEEQLHRLYEWIKDDNRKSAETAFTAGVMRNIAREFELLNMSHGMESAINEMGKIGSQWDNIICVCRQLMKDEPCECNCKEFADESLPNRRTPQY